MSEIWRDIDGYDGKYQVSNIGRIRSTYSGTKHRIVILKSMMQKNGYLYVILWKDNKKKHKLIHRLVALSFIENPNHYTEVNHKDENKENNIADNLEWCEHKYNMNYGNIKEKISDANSGQIPWNKGLKCPDVSLRQLGKPRPHIHKTIQSNNTTGFIGVSYRKDVGKYQANINVNKKQIYLGSYSNIEDAIKHRLYAEAKYYGEKAPQKHLFEEYNIISEENIDKGEDRND